MLACESTVAQGTSTSPVTFDSWILGLLDSWPSMKSHEQGCEIGGPQSEQIHSGQRTLSCVSSISMGKLPTMILLSPGGATAGAVGAFFGALMFF